MAKENFPYQLFTVGAEYSRNDINQRLVNSQVVNKWGFKFADSLVLFATLKKTDLKKYNIKIFLKENKIRKKINET